MIALTFRLPLSALAESRSTLDHPRAEHETLRDFLHRLQHELLWPRTLVRFAPPPDEVQPNAPARPGKRAGRRDLLRH